MRVRRCVAAALAALLAGCAAPRAPRIPDGEDYLYPAPRPGDLSASDARTMDKAWRDVLAGHTQPAERAYLQVLGRRPGWVPAQTGLGYARLRRGRFGEALDIFSRALGPMPDYVPALVGAGSAAFRLREPESALGFFKRAEAAADPGEALPRRRVAELKLQVTERRVAAARTALARADRKAAIGEYRLALAAAPEIAGLRVECADLLVAEGDREAALEMLRGDPGQDRQVLLRAAELLVEGQDFGGALEAYRRILARDPKDQEAQQRAVDARRLAELAGMPEEYRRIPAAARITRADLAALVMAKVTALNRAPRGEPDVAVDVSGSWARAYILDALALGVVTLYPNHTFQPGAVVRRGDLARAVGRVLDLLKHPAAPTPVITDMSRTNLFYDAAARAVAAGLMDLTPAGAFESWRPVSGADAADVIDAAARLVGP